MTRRREPTIAGLLYVIMLTEVQNLPVVALSTIFSNLTRVPRREPVIAPSVLLGGGASTTGSLNPNLTPNLTLHTFPFLLDPHRRETVHRTTSLPVSTTTIMISRIHPRLRLFGLIKQRKPVVETVTLVGLRTDNVAC